ncbi:MAG: Tryptophan--tRNA ligase, mitochondrial [Chrysothrix sp. TS-e1954]|nr:MAG: Tryptophan--tRNA ligase, mitochondrial [Chrysothrix sp. TS-e1954]
MSITARGLAARSITSRTESPLLWGTFKGHQIWSKRMKAARWSSSTTPESHGSRTIYSAIQPTGVQHLGNYLGAIKPWLELQDSAPDDTRIFAIADLHSLTSRTQTPAQRRQARHDTLATLLACGIDPTRSTIYFQSSVPQHAELHWVLSCDASMGWLSRMTTWKSKLSEEEVRNAFVSSGSAKSAERLKLGLFSYPVLQAADILLYRATHVPVGEDQFTHIDFARNAANVFNHTYGGGGAIGEDGRTKKGREILVGPWALMNEAKRVMSLIEPDKKMSKSHESEKSRILLSDSTDTINKKLRSALTDSVQGISYDREKRPGVSNLIDIATYLDGHLRTPTQVIKYVAELSGADSGTGRDPLGSQMKMLKQAVAKRVTNELEPIRERLKELRDKKHGTYLEEVAEGGRKQAWARAEETMKVVRDVVGL